MLIYDVDDFLFVALVSESVIELVELGSLCIAEAYRIAVVVMLIPIVWLTANKPISTLMQGWNTIQDVPIPCLVYV